MVLTGKMSFTKRDCNWVENYSLFEEKLFLAPGAKVRPPAAKLDFFYLAGAVKTLLFFAVIDQKMLLVMAFMA